MVGAYCDTSSEYGNASADTRGLRFWRQVGHYRFIVHRVGLAAAGRDAVAAGTFLSTSQTAPSSRRILRP